MFVKILVFGFCQDFVSMEKEGRRYSILRSARGKFVALKKTEITVNQIEAIAVTFFGFFHMYDLGVSFTFHFRKKNTESSVIFLRNGVLILN